jgi:hypothetical protein
VAGHVEQAAVVDDEAIGILADHGSFHAVVENLAGRAAERLEGGDVATQHAAEVLMQDVARPDEARMAEHQGEQPDDAAATGLVCEADLEAGEVDLGLQAGRGLEADLEGLHLVGPQLLHSALDRGVAAGEAAFAELAPQPHRRQPGIGAQTLPQVGQEVISALWSRRARTVARRIQAEGDVFAHRLAIEAELPGDGGRAEPLPVQFLDHDQFPNSKHRVAPSSPGSSIGESVSRC